MGGDRSRYGDVAPPSGGSEKSNLGGLFFDAHTRVKQSRQQDAPPVVKNETGDRKPDYGGPKPGDDPELGRIVRRMGTGPAILYELFLKTYNDRSNENVKPDSINVQELHPGYQERVSKWMLLGDSELNIGRDQYGGRNLRPSGEKNPGHFYAVGLDKTGSPVVVVDYYMQNNVPRYYQQFTLDYKAYQPGSTQVLITQHKAADQVPGMAAKASPQGDVFNGATEYVIDNQSGACMRVRKFSVWDTTQPELEVSFARGKPTTMRHRDPNSGRTYSEPLRDSQGQMRVRQQSNRFFFYNMFGNAL